MAVLCNFKFYSSAIIDDNEDVIEFNVKGYKQINDDSIVYYFKNDNEYKFIIKDNILSVNVNKSVYEFNKTKKTEAILNFDDYVYKASVVTNKLNLSDNKIEIEYVIDFVSFKGKYKIILELL